VARRRDPLVRELRAFADRLRPADPSLAELIDIATPGERDPLEYGAVIEALEAVADSPALDEPMHGEAHRVLAAARDLPALIGSGGVVFVTWYEAASARERALGIDDPARYSCDWQNHDEGDLDSYDGAEFDTLDEAMVWARRRTPAVIVRPEWDSGEDYVATDEPRSAWITLDQRFENRCEEALALVQRDLAATGNGELRTRLHNEPDRISGAWTMYAALPDGRWSADGAPMTSDLPPAPMLRNAASSVAATLREVMSVDWPMCRRHHRRLTPALGVDEELDARNAWWTCSDGDGHAVAPIGQLTREHAEGR
jgi:hypothetical protein